MKLTALLASLLALGAAAPAHGAEFYTRFTEDQNIITITGELNLNDEKTFYTAPLRLEYPTTVYLISHGGNLLAGILIGRRIRQYGWNTTVPEYQSCMSSCGNIWLAGKHRFLSEGARVGWHRSHCMDKADLACNNSGHLADMARAQRDYWTEMGMDAKLADASQAVAMDQIHGLVNMHGKTTEFTE